MQKMLFFDIETDGLLDSLTKMHCMVIIDDNDNVFRYDPLNCADGVRKLQDALNAGDYIVGHNIINFDVPAIEKLYSWFKVERSQRKQCIDTLVLGRLIYSNIKDLDYGLMRKGFPQKLAGKHSLEAYGYRLGELKGTYGKQEDAWSDYSPAMLEYNVQDVVVTKKLYEKLNAKSYSQTAIDLEHEVAWLMSQQERNGFPFDVEKAEQLECVLRGRYAELHTKLVSIVPQLPDKIFIPKRNNKTKGYVAGVPIQRYKEFNPGSRQQVLWLLENHYHYLPDNEELYKEETGNLKMDDDTFSFISTDPEAPEELRDLAKVFTEFFMIVKRLGQLADGKHAWLKHVEKDGYIHGSVNPNGAVTGRASHSFPNVAQVPAVNSPYGEECRELFHVPKGWFQAGTDASGLELRCLAHFMYPFDNGEYADIILNGDIHTTNQHAAGLPERNQAKTFIYALLYGAGDAKIGSIIGGNKKEGASIKKKFFKATPGMKLLREAVQHTLADFDKGRVKRWKRKYLVGLDGRHVHVKSPHSALNFLLQGAGALICKKWIVLLEERLIKRGFTHGWQGDFAYMAWVHDEVQIACRSKEIAEIVIAEAQQAMRDTQEFFKFRIQLDTEGKIGMNWKECH